MDKHGTDGKAAGEGQAQGGKKKRKDAGSKKVAGEGSQDAQKGEAGKEDKDKDT